MSDVFYREYLAACAERDALRAELAAGRHWLEARAAVLEELAETKAELAAERERAGKYQRIAAELTDMLNGTPCAEIRWHQERDALRAELANRTKQVGILQLIVGKIGQERAKLREALKKASKEFKSINAKAFYERNRIDALLEETE